nr:rhodanese-like domain-containing protein [Sedimentibacter sp.]
MKKKNLSLGLVLMLLISILAGCSANTEPPQNPADSEQETASFQYITADELKTILTEENSDYVIFDARKKADYDTEHIKGSISADVDSVVSNQDSGPAKANIEKALAETDVEGKKFVLLCYSGKRYAEAATGLLKEAGIDAANIYTLEGGYKGWTFSDLLEK